MLLLTNMLRSRYRGVIHFYPAEADSSPEIEFSGGEGPEQVMDQIQDVAVPEIRQCVEPLGPYLRWEELDLEAGVVRRHRSRFHDRFGFVLCPDELGIELVLPDDGAEPDAQPEPREDGPRARPWVPLRPLAEPGEDQLAAIGWSVREPELRWRYLKTRYAPPAIEINWSCASLPSAWAARVLAETTRLDCRLGVGERCPMNPTRDGRLVYRGFYPLPDQGCGPLRRDGPARPAFLPVALRQPLVVFGPDGPRGENARHELDGEVPATVEALDFRAVIAGRSTRLVARADLDRRFEAEVLTAEDVLLPEVIPAGAIAGLPWSLAVASAGMDEGDEPGAGEAEAGRRRWRLRPRPGTGTHGSWRQVAWDDEPPAIAFGLGAYDPATAPRITHIENRRASVAWRVEATDEGHRLCLCVPRWLPVGCPAQVALPQRQSNGFDYAAEVRARLDGLDERFVIDQRSEISSNRLFLGPRRWRFRDEASGAIDDGEALGEGSGCVRWRRSDEAGLEELAPTDWAGGSAPVLLRRKGEDDSLCWGGLYAPRAVPWDALEEVSAEPTPDPEEVLLVPRPALPGRPTAIWIDLWGFVCRYDARTAAFTLSRGESSEPTLWIAGSGLELFPRRGGYLLRSFSPLYAVGDPAPRTFSLRPTAPRPTLHIGRELDRQTGDCFVLEIGAETYVRCQLTEPGRAPETFEPGRVPGTRLRFERVGRRVVWLAVEQRRGGEGRRAGYLLSWDAAAGWRFRGFFAHPGTAAELGRTRRRGRAARVFLGAEGTCRVSTFRLKIDRHGDEWSAAAPEAVTRRVIPKMLRAWEDDHFAPERRPPPLGNYGMRILQQSDGDRPWVFEFFDRESRVDTGMPAGIRVWELHGDAGDELADGARELGEDPEETTERLPTPAKRILRADDDDDF